MVTNISWGRSPDLLAAQLRTAQMRIYNHFTEWFAEADLSAKQFSVLYIISLNPEVNQRQLASVQSTERASFGETLSRLEEKGLIERRPSPTDKRAKVAIVTPAGRKILDHVLEEIDEQERDFASNLTDSERHMLLSLLLKLNRPKMKS